MRAVIRMDARKKLACGKGFLWIEPEDLRSIVTPLGNIGKGIPFEGHHSSGGQRLLQSRLPLEKSSLVMTALREKRSENERAERDGQDAGLRPQNALFDGEKRIAEISDAKGRHPDQSEGETE